MWEGVTPRIERGHRERTYCNDTCRKRAARERDKADQPLQNLRRSLKHRLTRAREEAEASYQEAVKRQWDSVEQGVYREGWQDTIETQRLIIDHLRETCDQLEFSSKLQQVKADLLQEELIGKGAEIARLQTLLDGQSFRRRKPF